MKKSPQERFEQFVMPVTETGCWLWTGAVDSRNPRYEYGIFRMNHPRRNERANRAAWQIFRGPIPEGMLVCHKCDVPLCVNPDHLFLGTHKDNSIDMTIKNRNFLSKGENSNLSKLTAAQVLDIRTDKRLHREISAAYGIGMAHVSNIKNRKIWKHLL